MREVEQRAPGAGFRVPEPLGVGARREDRKPRGGLLGELGQLAGPNAILSCGVVKRRQPCLDACELARIEVEPLAVGSQRPRGFVGTYSCLVQKRDHVVQRCIVRSGLFEPLQHGSQT